MNPFGVITNFLGGLFGGGQKKKPDDQPAPPVAVHPVQPSNLPLGLGQNNTPGSVQAPKPLVPQTPQLGGTGNPSQYAGLTADDAASAQHIQSQGKDASAFITAARNANTAQQAANVANDPINKIFQTGINVVKDTAVDPVVNTAKSFIDMGKSTLGQVTGNQNLANEGNQDFQNDFKRSIPGAILAPLQTIGNTAGATIAGNQLLREGVDPTIVQEAMDKYTAPYGVSTQQSQGQNAMAIGNAAGQTALNLAGADTLLSPKRLIPETEAAALPSAALEEDLPKPATPQAVSSEPEPISVAPAEDSPIQPVNTPTKAPAITSTNYEVTPPSTQAPSTSLIPQETAPGSSLGGVPSQAPPTVAKPTIAPLSTADQATAAAQKAVDDAAVAPAPQPAAVSAVAADTPTIAAQKANPLVPPSPQAEAEAASAEKAVQAAQTPATDTTKQVPDYTPPVTKGKASVPGGSDAIYNTGDPNLDGIVHDAIISAKGTAGTAAKRAEALDKAGVSSEQATAIRDVATKNVDRQTGRITPAGQQQIRDIITGAEKVPESVTNRPPTPSENISATSENTAPNSQLGTIMREAAKNGELATDEGSKAAADKAGAALEQAAKDAGSSVEDINTKLHEWDEHNANAQNAKDKAGKQKWTSYEQAGLTPEEAKVAQSMQQELSFVRNRAIPDVTAQGGDRGLAYSPRSVLDEDGNPQPFTQDLVNENVRNGKGTSNIDLTSQPVKDYLRRYANAPTSLSDKITSLVENDSDGAATGVKLSDEAKSALADQAKTVVEHNDAAARLDDAGDSKGAQKERAAANDGVTKMVNIASDDIPKGVAGRSAIIDNVKSVQQPYSQSLSRTIQQSSIPNRLRDLVQGTGVKVQQRVLAPITRPIARGILKVVNPTDSLVPISKEDAAAAADNASGTLINNVKGDLKTTVGLAGAGRSLPGRIAAKSLAAVKGTGTAGTSLAGDLSTQVKELANRFALESKPAGVEPNQWLREQEGSPLMQHSQQQAERQLNPYVNLPGGGRESTPVSNFLSKNVDNMVSTGAQKLADKAGVTMTPGVKAFVKEVNDTVTPRLFGYAGATSRAGSIIKNDLTLGLLRAHQILQEGAPGASGAATEAVSRALLDVSGTAAGVTAIGALAKSGTIGVSGAYPSDPNEQARWAKEGIQPDSIYVKLPDGKYASLGVTQLAQGGNAGIGLATAIIGNAKNVPAGMTDFVSQLVNNTGGGSLIDDASNTSAALNSSNPTGQAKGINKLTEALVPGSGLLGNAANVVDPNKRAPGNAIEQAESELPLARNNVPVAKDSSGNPIANVKQASGGSSLFTVGATPPDFGKNNTQTNDPVQDAINNFAKAGIEITPVSSNTNASNANVKALSTALLSDPIYTSADQKTQATMLKDVLAGTSTKDISPDISTTSQQALLDHSLLGKKAAAWLDDNTNNANYQTANLENATANGTLTDADKDITNPKGLLYQATAAQVDQKVNADYQLKDGYSTTSQSAFKALLNPKSDTYDPDTADKLYAYDQARVAAGLPPKYNLAAAQKAASGGSGQNFAFASLPSSLLGTSSSGTSSSSKYAAAAPLFSPIHDLVAPPTVVIPKGRSISVSKVQTV